MFRFVQVFVFSSLLLLSACGGGSSSGGGSGLVYTGEFSITLSAGSNFAREKGGLTATVKGNFVTITFDDGTVFSGEVKKSGDIRIGSLRQSVVGAIDGCTAGTIRISVFLKPEERSIFGLIGGDDIVCEGTSFNLVGNLNARAV
jgi:hypothetical protein